MRVYSHPYWLLFFVQPKAAECWRERGGKLSRILEKTTQYLMNTLYVRANVSTLWLHFGTRFYDDIRTMAFESPSFLFPSKRKFAKTSAPGEKGSAAWYLRNMIWEESVETCSSYQKKIYALHNMAQKKALQMLNTAFCGCDVWKEGVRERLWLCRIAPPHLR